MAFIPACPFCFHHHSLHVGELYCSNSVEQAKKDTSDHCIKWMQAKKIEETDWHQTRLTVRYVLGGSERFITREKELLLRPGRFLILNHGQYYKTSMDSDIPVQALTVAYKKGYVESLLASFSASANQLLENPFYGVEREVLFSETIYEDRHVSQLLAGMVNLLSKEKQVRSNTELEDFYRGVLEGVLEHTHQVYRNMERIQSIKAATRKELYRRLCLAYECIEEQYATNLTLEMLAQAACLSVPYLKRVFREFYQQTPYSLIVTKRLEKARQLLRTTELPVHQVAVEVGFENASSFIRLFKNRYAITPTAFRASA
jgi:AraC family transcriptional regulator